MALTDAIDNDEEQATDTSEDPSGTHLYFYEEGHSRMDGWPQAVQSIVSDAYEAANENGVVRLTINNSNAYYNLSHVLAEFIVGLRALFEDQDFGPLMELVGPDADAIRQYLEENPEVLEEFRSEMRAAQEASADTGSE